MLYEIDNCANDTSTIYKHHNVFTHLGCVMLRVGIGYAISMQPSTTIHRSSIIWFLCLVLAIFVTKFASNMYSNTLTWKAYQRTVISYLGSLLFALNHRYSEAGLLIIADAAMATQSRHMAYVATHC